METSNYSDEFKRDAVHQITARGSRIASLLRAAWMGRAGPDRRFRPEQQPIRGGAHFSTTLTVTSV